MKSNRKIGWLFLVCSAIGAFLLWKLETGAAAPDRLALSLAEFAGRPAAPWLAFAAVAVGGLVVFPAAPTLLFAGALLGSKAYPIAFAGLFFSFTVGYWIGRSLGDAALGKSAKGDKMRALLIRHGALASVVARLTGVPFALQNLMLGSARVPWWPCVAGSSVGVAIVTYIFVTAGMAGARALSQLQAALHYGGFVPVVGAVTGVYFLLAKSKKPAVQAAAPDERT